VAPRAQLHEHSSQLRERAASEQFDAHPSEVLRLLARGDVLTTGDSAGELVGLIGRPQSAEAYATAASRSVIVDEHGLMAGNGLVRMRWVPDQAWRHVAIAGSVPRIEVLVDLLESDDPRARREAARALAR
jgi:hypothetical protein